MGRNTPARKPADKLSTDPRAIRARLRKGTNVERDLALLTQAGHMKPIEDWDIEELARGRPRGSNGKFQGAAPAWLTEAHIREAKKRLITLSMGEMGAYVTKAIKVVADVMNDKEESGRTRLDAAKFIIEHVVGKAPATIEVTSASEQAKTTLNAILMTRDEDGNLIEDYDPGVIEGDSWEVKDDDED